MPGGFNAPPGYTPPPPPPVDPNAPAPGDDAYEMMRKAAARAKQTHNPYDQNGNVDRGNLIGGTSSEADRFSQQGMAGFNALGAEQAAQRARLQQQANGRNLVSPGQLRQSLQQNFNQQSALAAGASPTNTAGAARTAMMNRGMLGSALSGQTKLASLQEQQAAQQTLGGLISGARDQDLRATQGARDNALQGYGYNQGASEGRWKNLQGQPTDTDQILSAAQNGMQTYATARSDKRSKTNIASGDDDAKDFLKHLKAYSFDYKDKKHGAGPQVGIMAQDLEKSKAGRAAVIDTPSGKEVHGAKLATALAAVAAMQNKRITKLEGKRGK